MRFPWWIRSYAWLDAGAGFGLRASGGGLQSQPRAALLAGKIWRRGGLSGRGGTPRRAFLGSNGRGPRSHTSRSHTSTDFRASRVRLFGLRVLARAAGFGLTRLWFSRIPVGRFDPVCVRLRAGRVLLSGHRAAWKRGFGARREVSAAKQGFRESRNQIRTLRWLRAWHVLRDRRNVAARLRKRRLKRANLRGL